MSSTYFISSDHHIGASVSLCKPVVNLDDGGTYHASPLQLFLWRSWENILEQVERKKTGELITDLNGDLIEGDVKDRSKQLITRNAATIKTLVNDIFDPLAKMSAGLFVKRGTEAHTGKSAELEEEIALDLEANRNPETKTASWWFLPYICEGVKILSYHHPRGNGGGRPMNRYSMIDALASDTVFTFANDRREEPPDIVICSHVHGYKDSYDHFRTRAITTPCWTGLTSHVARIGQATAIPDIGGILIHCSAGHYEVEAIRYAPKPSPYYSFGSFKQYDPGL